MKHFKWIKKEKQHIERWIARFLKQHPLTALFDCFYEKEVPLYLVGGAVRDLVLAYERRKAFQSLKKHLVKTQKPYRSFRVKQRVKLYSQVQDFDFACPAPLKKIQSCCEAFRKQFTVKSLTVQELYQSVAFEIEETKHFNLSIKITRTRSEAHLYKTTYLKKAIFTQNLKWDARRRDFLCNAFYYSPPHLFSHLSNKKKWARKGHQSGLFLPLRREKKAILYALQELKEKKLTMIGSTEKRIRQDALRYLRGLRLARLLELKLDENFEKLRLPFTKKEFASKAFRKEFGLWQNLVFEKPLTLPEEKLFKAYQAFLENKRARKI